MDKTNRSEKILRVGNRLSFITKISLGAFAVAILFIIIFYFSVDEFKSIDNIELIKVENWEVTDPKGNVTTAGDSFRNADRLDGAFSAESTLPDEIRDGYEFCVIVGSNISVYINGELRREFDETRDMVLPGGVVKRFYLTVPLYDEDSGAHIKMEGMTSSRKGYIYQETFITTGSGLFPILAERYGMSFMLSAILFLFSLTTVIISLAMSVMYRRRLDMLYGALSILVISGWLVTNSYFCPFVFGHYHIDGIVNYILCLMMPFNLIFYLDSLQHGRYRRIMNATLMVSSANLVLWTVLHFTGVMSFPKALFYIDTILGLQIVTVSVILVLEVVKGNAKEYKYTAIGFGLFFICCAIELFVLAFIPVLVDDVSMMIGLALLLILAVIQQISDLRKVRLERQKAVDLSEAKTRFLASMSHEIRTPINAILGMNEMILRENKDPVIDDYAESVKSSGKMLLMLVNDVLDFSKIEAGKMEINSVNFSMSQLLRDIMPMLKERADDKKLKLETKIASEVPDGQISDEFRIRQILINLINNGIKYTDNGSVTLTIGGTYRSDNEFLLNMSISDTGRGISEEDQEHLFEAFTRADVKKNRSIEGTGLGLAIVKSIIDSLGGNISVKSKYLEGSVFTIELTVGVWDKKLLKEDFLNSGKPSKKSVEKKIDYTAPNAAILVVDDNIMNLKVVRYFLKRADIKPDECDRGLLALEKCKEKKYDLILLDHMMPEPDGIETLRLIRSEDASLNKETPAIVLTANAFTDSRKIYTEAGFLDYLTKPLDASLLEETVKKYLPPEKVLKNS